MPSCLAFTLFLLFARLFGGSLRCAKLPQSLRVALLLFFFLARFLFRFAPGLRRGLDLIQAGLRASSLLLALCLFLPRLSFCFLCCRALGFPPLSFLGLASS